MFFNWKYDRWRCWFEYSSVTFPKPSGVIPAECNLIKYFNFENFILFYSHKLIVVTRRPILTRSVCGRSSNLYYNRIVGGEIAVPGKTFYTALLYLLLKNFFVILRGISMARISSSEVSGLLRKTHLRWYDHQRTLGDYRSTLFRRIRSKSHWTCCWWLQFV